MAMIMQELFTNSLKYGSFTTAQGQVTITWNLFESTASGKKSSIALARIRGATGHHAS